MTRVEMLMSLEKSASSGLPWCLGVFVVKFAG
jgi:hypothetical protein